MKLKTIFITLMLIGLLTAPSFRVFSQTSASSTVSTDETISFLLSQNREAKKVIGEQENRIADLESQVAVEQENSASVGKSYESAKAEIVNLKSANESLRKAVSTNEATIALLQTDNAKQKEKAKKATKDKWKAYAVTASVIVIRLLIP